MRNLHLIWDSPYYASFIKQYMEIAAPNENTFIVYSRDSDDLKKIKYEDYKAIFIHFASPTMAKWLNLQVKGNTKWIWVLWGGDMYNQLPFRHQIYLSYSKKYWQKTGGPFWQLTKNIVKKILGRPSSFDIFSFFRKVDVCVAFKGDYDIVKSFLSKSCIYFPYLSYVPVDDMILPLVTKSTISNEILVGNSDDMANNHIEAFQIIKRTSSTAKVICPLPPDSPGYVRSVCDQGEKILGGRFQPILQFLPVNEFYPVLDKCGFVLFNQIRQQGLSTAIYSLYHGSKLFMRRENPMYQYFKELGLIVFDIEKDTQYPEVFDELLSPEQVKLNQAILEKNYNRTKVIEYYKQLVSFGTSDHMN